jgi:hypothetical protein
MNMKNFDLDNNYKITSGFITPENYFEQFEAKIMHQISAQKSAVKEAKVVSLFHRKQVWMSSIAALFLLSIALPVYFNSVNESSLHADTIEHYLAQQSVGTTELTKHLTNDDILELETSLGVSTSESEEIVNYLNTEDLDYILNEY